MNKGDLFHDIATSAEAAEFTYEDWSKAVDSLFGEGFPADTMYIVHPEEARRLRAEWALEVRKRGNRG